MMTVMSGLANPAPGKKGLAVKPEDLGSRKAAIKFLDPEKKVSGM